jgi:hypothetical protein
MTDKPAIGKNLYNEALVRGRHSASAAREALRRLIDEQPGPQTTSLLIAKVALSIAQLEAVLNELDEIGRNAKMNGSTRTKRQ